MSTTTQRLDIHLYNVYILWLFVAVGWGIALYGGC